MGAADSRSDSLPCHVAWRLGRIALARALERDTLPLEHFIAQVHSKPRVAGTAIYVTSRVDVVPLPLLHNLKHNKVLHERIALLHVIMRHVPRVLPDKRLKIVRGGQRRKLARLAGRHAQRWRTRGLLPWRR